MKELFANTGVQILLFHISQTGFSIDQVGRGWQICRLGRRGPAKTLSWLQWRFEEGPPRLFLAVDTTLGPENHGYLADPNTFSQERKEFTLDELLDATGNATLELGTVYEDPAIPTDSPISFAIRARGDGDPRDVHLAVDFGNNRTGALLVESGRGSRDTIMTPLELVNRYRLDAWDERGHLIRRAQSRWFTSQTHFCGAPFLDPPIQTYEQTRSVVKTTIFGSRTVIYKEVIEVQPALFLDLSLVRMGKEGVDVTGAIYGKDRPLTGVSSPKRYLWADDDAWLDGANWYMADPFDRHSNNAKHFAPLRGGLLKYLPLDDNDSLLNDEPFSPCIPPTEPKFPPRVLMTAALYEMIGQAYTMINSVSYREQVADSRRLRRLGSMSLSYPSGMIAPERRRLETQAKKASKIFDMTLGRSQARPVIARLSVDEASAVHLTYIWSELQLIDGSPELWFSVAGRRRIDSEGSNSATSEGSSSATPEIRIACIDIGGGTTDLMIARYSFERDLGGHTRLTGKVLHRDGISLAGDQMIKRLLERIIVPTLGRATGLNKQQLNILFGPEGPQNLKYRSQRIDWMNRLLVPLAVAYLENANLDSSNPISHTNTEIVNPELVDSLQRLVNDEFGIGQIDVRRDMDLQYNAQSLDDVVRQVFQDLLFDFCGRIVDQDADIVLLAGQPTRLQSIQKLIQGFLPLTKARIVPMYDYYAGNQYPYQDESGANMGRIVDPKSAVVVGTAIHYQAIEGMLTQFGFEMDDPIRTQSYNWGVMNPQTFKIDERSIWFKANTGNSRVEQRKFPVRSESLPLGRRLSSNPRADASPVYQLRCKEPNPTGDPVINVEVEMERHLDPASQEELLRIKSVRGTVKGRPAENNGNVQLKMLTLAHERYYLDTGALDNIAAP